MSSSSVIAENVRVFFIGFMFAASAKPVWMPLRLPDICKRLALTPRPKLALMR